MHFSYLVINTLLRMIRGVRDSNTRNLYSTKNLKRKIQHGSIERLSETPVVALC